MLGKRAVDVFTRLEEGGAELLAVVRGGVRLSVRNPTLAISAGDVLVIETAAKSIDKLMGEFGLEYLVPEQHDRKALEDLALIEVVARRGPGSRHARRRVPGCCTNSDCPSSGFRGEAAKSGSACEN
jgi:hypothetical protein